MRPIRFRCKSCKAFRSSEVEECVLCGHVGGTDVRQNAEQEVSVKVFVWLVQSAGRMASLAWCLMAACMKTGCASLSLMMWLVTALFHFGDSDARAVDVAAAVHVGERVDKAPMTMQVDVEKTVEASHGRESEGAGSYIGSALILLRLGSLTVIEQLVEYPQDQVVENAVVDPMVAEVVQVYVPQFTRIDNFIEVPLGLRLQAVEKGAEATMTMQVELERNVVASPDGRES